MSLEQREDQPDVAGGGPPMDWGLAATVGKRLSRPGPRTTDYTKAQAREELARLAVAAESPVREVTGLADGLPVPTARILNRREWIDAAAVSMSAMLGTDAGDDTDHGITGKVAGKVGGVQAGGLLAFLSGAILGQFDPFTGDTETGAPGTLMLVAPNIIAVERQLKVVPSDFRLWVCLHEVTHRVQFSANPWLRGYMRENIELLTSDSGETNAEIINRITGALRDGRPREKGVLGAVQLLQSPEQYEAFSRMMMLGTLLEGHADHVMDAVGPAQVPSVATIREAFDKRRASGGNPIQRIIKALIGMDAKIAQYIRGKAFVDEVVATVGMADFNTIWTSAETMPLPEEIEEPARWISRVL